MINDSNPTGSASAHQPSFKYWAFISYSSKDRTWGEWLINSIETYRTPRELVGRPTTRGEPVPRRAFPLFRDRDELPTDADLGGAIRRALQESRYLIVICSPNSAASRWVNEEILTFKRLGRENRILSLIVDGSPNASSDPAKDPKLECYPHALRFALGTDGNLSAERTHPISADARAHGDGKQNSLLKLLAGVLGVNYDDLKRRDETRRRRRRWMALGTIAAFAVVVVAASFWGLKASRLEVQSVRRAERDAAESGRLALLRGDSVVAAQQLARALELAPTNDSLRLMLRAALGPLSALRAVVPAAEKDFESLPRVDPQGRWFATNAVEGGINIWKQSDGALVRHIGSKLGNKSVDVRFSRDGRRYLVVDGRKATIESLDDAPPVVLAPADGDISTSETFFTRDGERLVALVDFPNGRRLVTWSLADGAIVSSVSPSRLLIQCELNAAETRLIAIDSGPAAGPLIKAEEFKPVLVDATTGAVLGSIPVEPEDDWRLNPTGDSLLIQGEKHPPRIYSFASGKVLGELKADGIEITSRGHWTSTGNFILISDPASGLTQWDGRTGKLVRRWTDISWENVTTVDSSEKYLATTEDGKIRVWDFVSGKLLNSWTDRLGINPARAPNLELLRFTADGQTLIVTTGSLAKAWSWHAAFTTRVLSGHEAAVNSIAFRADGAECVTTGDDGRAIVWDMATGSARLTLQAATSGKHPNERVELTSAGFTPDGARIISAGYSHGGSSPGESANAGPCPPRIWDARSGAPVSLPDFVSDSVDLGEALAIAISPRGDRMAAFSSVGAGELRDLPSLTLRKSYDHRQSAAGLTYAPVVAFSRDGDRFITTDPDRRSARVFASDRGELLFQLESRGFPVGAAEFNPHSPGCLTLETTGAIMLWDGSGHFARMLNPSGAVVNEVHYSFGGDKVVAACADQHARVWQCESGKLLADLTIDASVRSNQVLFDGEPPHLHAEAIGRKGLICAAFSPDGTLVAGGMFDGNVAVWDVASGRQLLNLRGHKYRINALVFSPDGARLASASYDRTARIWDLGLERRTPAEVMVAVNRLSMPATP